VVIKNISISDYSVELKKPFTYFTAKLKYLPYSLIRAESDSGLIGYGEASLAWDITGETQDGAKAMFKFAKPIIIDKEVNCTKDIAKIMSEINLHINANTGLKSGIEMALLDLLGKKTQKPLYQLFISKNCKKIIKAQKVLSFEEENREKIIREVEKAKKLGVKHIKIKVGQDIEKNIKLLDIINGRHPEIKLVLDVNQGWKNAEKAIPIIKRLEKYNIIWIEQPTNQSEIGELSKIRKKTNIKIMADESCHCLTDLKALHLKNSVDLINIKIAKTGGFFEALKMINYCELNGIKYMLGDMLCTDLGTAANLHLSVLGNFEAYDLTDPKRIKKSIFSGIKSNSYEFEVPQKSGLGIKKTT